MLGSKYGLRILQEGSFCLTYKSGANNDRMARIASSGICRRILSSGGSQRLGTNRYFCFFSSKNKYPPNLLD